MERFDRKLGALVLKIGLIISLDVRPEINKYCRDKERLASSEENDEYLLVDAEINTTILIECHFCREKDDQMPKIWYWQDRFKSQQQKEVELGLNNNMSYNRIHVTPESSLVIKNFDPGDEGIYKCHSKEGQEEDLKFNYRLEPIFSETGEVYTEKGNLTGWEKYHEEYLAPVSLRFAISRMKEVSEIREMGVILEVVTEWGPWSSCERCVRKRGFKTSHGFCRIKRRIDTEQSGNRTLPSTANLFLKSPMLPCRSEILDIQFPGIGKATRYLPEFILEQSCKTCKRIRRKKKDVFKYKKRYVLAEGAHLTIICPESNLETQVVWKKDANTLKKGTGHSFRKKDPEPRVLVDTFATLYLIGVSHEEEGNYTCFVDNVKMMQVKVIVVSSLFLTQAFLRHMGYLGFIFLLSSFCYCAGLVVVCRQKDKFKITDYKEIEAKENDRPTFYGTD